MPDSENEFDRDLEKALSRYANVEPRLGLEQRILANLQAQSTRPARHLWWRWSVAVVAMAVITAAAVLWNHSRRSRPEDAKQTPVIQFSVNPPGGRDASDKPGTLNGQSPNRTPERHARALPPAGSPKLDQFPSRQPLSEQEQMLARYVTEFPERAVLMAKLQEEDLRHDQEEEKQYGESFSSQDR